MSARHLLNVLCLLLAGTALRAQAPNWSFSPNNYQYTASMVAQLNVDGALQTAPLNSIAVFVGSQVRGLAQPMPNTQGLYFLSIYSNTVSGEALSLKAWVPALNVTVDILETFTFSANQLWGTPEAPVQLHGWSDGDVPISVAAVPAQIAIRPGSFPPLDLSPYLEQYDGDPVVWTVASSANMTASLTGSMLTVTPNSPAWSGTENITVTATEQTANQYAATRPISYSMLPGYFQASWDSIPSQAIATTESFSDFDLDDYIQDTYAGTCLDFGYQVDSFAGAADVLPAWTLNPASFLYSMSVTGKAVFTPTFVFEHPGDRIAAFMGSTLVGLAAPVSINGSNYFFLTVYANSAAPSDISFRFFSAAKSKVFDLPEKLVFQPVAQVGGVDDPYLFDASPLGFSFGAGNVVSVARRDPNWIGLVAIRFSAAECNYALLSNDTITANFTVGLIEICDGIDNDGDTHVDEGLRGYYHLDNDGDSYGTGDTFIACHEAPNIADDNLDCDDTNPAINPGATEICNNIDDDCDLLLDSDDPGIVDPTPPTALCRPATVYLGTDGSASLTAGMVDNGSSDACGIASLSLGQTTFGCANTGPNAVVLTVTDNNGLTSTCTATVTVLDTVPPSVACRAITVQFSGTSVAFQPADIFDAAASTDNCGTVVPVNVTPTTSFSCSQAGDFTVTLHAADPSGNMGTCQATVTVLPFVTLDTVIQTPPGCNASNGGFEVVASVPIGQLGFSLNGGTSWQFSGLFMNLPAGMHTVTMQVFGYPGCTVPPLTVALSEANGTAWYLDNDGDDYSDGTSILACSQPAGWYAAGSLAATSGDCNDANPAINPGATEACNGVDDDCNGAAESATNNWTGSGDGTLWSDPANWSDATVPLPCQDVTLPTGSSVLVPTGFQAFAKTLTVVLGANLSVALTGTVTVLP